MIHFLSTSLYGLHSCRSKARNAAFAPMVTVFWVGALHERWYRTRAEPPVTLYRTLIDASVFSRAVEQGCKGKAKIRPERPQNNAI